MRKRARRKQRKKNQRRKEQTRRQGVGIYRQGAITIAGSSKESVAQPGSS